jgi:hypothetical protein
MTKLRVAGPPKIQLSRLSGRLLSQIAAGFAGGFFFAFAGRAEPLILLFPLLRRGFWRLPRKSGGPPLFAPSLNVQGDDTHNHSGFSVI